MARIWNKYPYTDFHELNADWILDQLSTLKSQVDEFTERVIAMEDDVADLKTRMTSAEGRLTTAEADIDALEGRAGSAEDRLDAIEGSDIMDAVMLSDMAGVTRDASSVTISFEKETYTDGAKGQTESDPAVIPAASNTLAGVLIPEDKAKLNQMTINNDGITFSGTVGGSAPVANNDYATKQYVDNMAISGSASVTSAALTPESDCGTLSYSALDVKIWRYGSVRMLKAYCYMNDLNQTTDIPINGYLFTIPLSSGDLPPMNNVSAWLYDGDTVSLLHAFINKTTGKVYVQNKSGAIIPAGTGFAGVEVYLTWLVE